MLIEYLAAAFVLGIVVAIPPGSVTVIACRRAIQFGFRNSMFFNLGSRVSDIFYLTLVYLGVAHIIADNRILKIALWIASSSILMFLGIQSLVTIRKNSRRENEEEVLRTNSLATFVSGMLVTLTNPMTIVGWVVVAGNFYLIWIDRFPESKNLGVVSILIIAVGVLAYFVPLTFIVSRLRKRLGERLKRWFIIVSNVCLIVFGIIALYYAINTIVAKG